jgi:Helix-hairpin-helix motif
MEKPMKISRARFLLHLSVVLLACGIATFGARAGQSSKKTEAEKSTKSDAIVDLNTASEKDLDGLPGVGPATAKKIIAGRPYSAVGDLSKAGVSAATLKKITPLVTVSGGTATESTKEDAKNSSKTTTKESAAVPPPTPASAPAAKTAAPVSQGTPGAGNVWVNLESGVYHYEGSRYYGKTKTGKYMSETDAVKAGYHAAKNEKKPQ